MSEVRHSEPACPHAGINPGWGEPGSAAKFRAGDSPALKGAFSLIELIVVIAIIALLLALLLPALSRARRQANVVQCLANLRTIGHAALLHAHDHHGYLPSAGWEWDCENGLTNPVGMEDAAVQKYMYY